MERDNGNMFFFIIVIIIILGSGTYFVHSKTSCDDKHGVLVKNAMGTYSCVEQGKH